MRQGASNQWFMDPLNENLYTMYRVRREVLNVRTHYQEVRILDTYQMGRVLVLDNKIQSAEYDEFIYHECLVHPAMVGSASPQHVLILGGGEGAALREVVRYCSMKRVVMVDLDREIIDICKQHLPSWHAGAFKDSRLDLKFDDARAYMESSNEMFDVIIMDISDPIEGGPASELYTKEFFTEIKRHMHPSSLFVMQALEIYLKPSHQHAIIHNTLKQVFTNVASYYEYVPSYGSFWGFAICSEIHEPARLQPDMINERLHREGINSLRYYDGIAHQRIFCLPRVISDSITRQKRIATLENPITITMEQPLE